MNQRLSHADNAHALDVARSFDREHGITEQNKRWAHLKAIPDSAIPTLHIDDVSGIPFLQDIVGIEYYQLRARVRARDGDLFVATCPDPGLDEYEAYNQSYLGLGDARLLHAPHPSPTEVSRGCQESACFDTLIGVAQEHGGLNIHPYMGIEAVWCLADALHQASGVRIGVIAPPPPATWFANDKLSLTTYVSAMLGDEAIVPTLVGRDAQTLAQHLVTLSRDNNQVALKMLRCASAMGNQMFEATDVIAAAPGAFLARVERFLADKEWVTGSPVLAVAWEPARASPSAQTWIPSQGAPVVDGVFEQLLEGENKVFLGSIPSRLGADVDARIRRASLMLTRGYQALGYMGRCSFDTIYNERLRFIECNGRWGGTSTPMHLMDRIFPAGRPAYRAQDVVFQSLIGVGFNELIRRLGDELYDSRTKKGRFILYNVGSVSQYGKFDVIAIGDSIDEASDALARRLPELVTA